MVDSVWNDKHRPKTLSELKYQNHVVNSIEPYLSSEHNKEMPNLLLSGPPGIGKTSLVLAFCRDLYKLDFDQMHIFRNASCDRKFSVLQQLIISFAKDFSNKKKLFSKYNFRIIILDEVDSLPINIQTLLRQSMEEFKDLLRFCLVCNDDRKIDINLKTRCAEFKLIGLDEKILTNNIKKICIAENFLVTKNLSITEEGNNIIKTVVNLCNRDMRRAINLLHNVYKMMQNNESSENTIENIYKLTGKCGNDKIEIVDNLLWKLEEKKIIKRATLIKNLTEIITNYFIHINYFLEQLIKLIRNKYCEKLPMVIKAIALSETLESIHLSQDYVIKTIANTLLIAFNKKKL